MSIFDQTNSKENSEELLYQTIKEELKPLLEKWDRKCGTYGSSDNNIYWTDPDRTKLIKATSRIVLQFVWKKLGMKLPEYTKQFIDNDYNILEMKTNNPQ